MVTNVALRPLGMLAFLLAAGSAPGVGIAVSIDPPGPIAVGGLVTVNLAVSDWMAADGEVDAVSFYIDFDPARFEYVSGSGSIQDDGSEFLALPNQGAGYALVDLSDASLVAFGRYVFGAADFGNATSGSIGPDGFLGSFQLKAIAAGQSAVTPGTNDPDSVFGDVNFFGIAPTGGVFFNGMITTNFVPMTYAVWAAAIAFPPGEGDPEDDPDWDLVTNLMEYGLAMNPLLPDRTKLPELGVLNLAGANYLTLTYRRPAGVLTRTDLDYEGARSVDLSTFTTVGVVETVGPPDPGTGLELVVLRRSTPIGAGGVAESTAFQGDGKEGTRCSASARAASSAAAPWSAVAEP